MYLSRLAAVFAAFFLFASAALPQTAERETLAIESANGTHEFQVEIADDAREHQRGLMFRREMADEAGMLFVYGADQRASFWMRNTYIPLDMLFVKADGTIESIAKRTTPLSEKSVRSNGPVRFVLEINGGLCDELGITPGDMVTGPAIETRQD
jgi:uncharacterized membrane protein (UPF0127 family)